jgi:hypothetical protein
MKLSEVQMARNRKMKSLSGSSSSGLDPDSEYSPCLKQRSWWHQLMHANQHIQFRDPALETTMESKYCICSGIAEFWCCVTSIAYASSILIYAVPRSEWSSVWHNLGYLPPYLHICCFGGVIVAFVSGFYHALLWEGLGSIDCSMAISLAFAVLMTSLGIPFWYQFAVLLPCILTFLAFWRQGNILALFLGAVGCPFNIWNCAIRGWYLGALSMIFMFLGISCFVLDRLKKFPLHSLWHVFSAASIFCTLLAVVYDGPALETFRSRPWS